MRAFGFTTYGGPDVQQFLDLPEPAPGPGQLLVRVHAAGVNPFDVKVRSGVFAGGKALDAPYVLGRELAGVVAALGAGVGGFAVGDRVFGNAAAGSGGIAELATVNASSAAHVPAGVALTDAAAFPVAGGTGAAGIRQLGLSPGQTVLVNGASGGVGLASAQVARALGLRVVGTASARKKELVESVGAVHVTYGAGVAGRVRAAAPGGVDGIWDVAGGDSLRAVAPLARGGAIVTAVDADTAAEFGGSYLRYLPPAEVYPWIAELAAAGAYDPHVGRVYPFAEAAAALAAVEGGTAAGKVVVAVRP